jgi:hypothetical protein
MADIDNSLILHDLRKETIVREIIEKTKNRGIVWSYLSGNQFQAEFTRGANTWTYFISKTQIGSLSYKYNMDIKRNGDIYITLSDGPMGSSNRDSQTKDLYEVVEILTLQLDLRVSLATFAIQNVAAGAQG